MEPQALPLNCEGGDRWSKLVNCHNCASAAIALSLREPVQAHMTIVRQRSRRLHAADRPTPTGLYRRHLQAFIWPNNSRQKTCATSEIINPGFHNSRNIE